MDKDKRVREAVDVKKTEDAEEPGAAEKTEQAEEAAVELEEGGRQSNQIRLRRQWEKRQTIWRR